MSNDLANWLENFELAFDNSYLAPVITQAADRVSPPPDSPAPVLRPYTYNPFSVGWGDPPEAPVKLPKDSTEWFARYVSLAVESPPRPLEIPFDFDPDSWSLTTDSPVFPSLRPYSVRLSRTGIDQSWTHADPMSDPLPIEVPVWYQQLALQSIPENNRDHGAFDAQTTEMLAQVSQTWLPFVNQAQDGAQQITHEVNTVATDEYAAFLQTHNYRDRLREAGLYDQEVELLRPLLEDELVVDIQRFKQGNLYATQAAAPLPEKAVSTDAETSILQKLWLRLKRILQSIRDQIRRLLRKAEALSPESFQSALNISVTSENQTYHSQIRLDADTTIYINGTTYQNASEAELQAHLAALDQEIANRKRWLDAIVLVGRIVRTAIQGVVALPVVLASVALGLLIRGIAVLKKREGRHVIDIPGDFLRRLFEA